MKFFVYPLMFLFVTNVWAQDTLKRVYVNNTGEVYVTTSNGTEIQLTKSGRATQPQLSKDQLSAGWLLENSWTAEGDQGPGSSNLIVYRDGKFQHIKCLPFIRDYWFWEDGRKVGIDCGGRHFAGKLMLYDVLSGKMIDSVFQPDIPYGDLPAWAKSY